MQISAPVQDDIIKLPADVHLPDGTPVQIIVNDDPSSAVLPPGYFERVAGALADEPFERLDQGEFEGRIPQ